MDNVRLRLIDDVKVVLAVVIKLMSEGCHARVQHYHTAVREGTSADVKCEDT